MEDDGAHRVYLEQLSITTVEDKLNSYVGAVLNAGDARGEEINGETETTFTRDLEEGDGLREVCEARRVAGGR